MLELRAEKIAVPAGRGREVIGTIRQGLREEGSSSRSVSCAGGLKFPVAPSTTSR